MAVKRNNAVHAARILGGGNEPIVTKGPQYRIQLTRALGWYNVNKEEKDYRAYATQYVKTSADSVGAVYAIGKASFMEIRSIGVIGRLISRGQYVDISDTFKIVQQIEELKSKYKRSPAIRSTGPLIPQQSIQERIIESARTHAAEIEHEIDQFVVNKQSEFTMKSYLLSNQISGMVAKKIGTFFGRLQQELGELVAGKDVQLKEGYSNLTRIQCRRFLEFVRSIISDCDQHAVSSKTTRKPRARKAKPPGVQAAKIKPMGEFAPLNLKSIDPAKIIGASELWVYTPASRKLTVYRGSDGPIGVSGMSITNYDISKSETKTIRKPEEFFKNLPSTGKRALSNAWKAVKSKSSSPRSRINGEMILLAAN